MISFVMWTALEAARRLAGLMSGWRWFASQRSGNESNCAWISRRSEVSTARSAEPSELPYFRRVTGNFPTGGMVRSGN